MLVNIKTGRYRNIPIQNTVFPVIQPWKMYKKGGYVTVNAADILPGLTKIRVRVDREDYEVVDGSGAEIEHKMASGHTTETDEQVIERIAARFEILNEMTRGTVDGIVRAMIVVGPPGVGKSFGVENELRKSSLLDRLGDRPVRYEVVKGAMTAVGLFKTLYEYSDEGQVLVFDDCDSILLDDISLNVLKAALDSSKKRTICWNSDSSLLRKEGIPNKFDFKGSVIFITNLKFDHVRSVRLRDHLDALMSRCHYLDLTIDTRRDKLLRIKQIAQTGTLFPNYGMNKDQEQEIIDFMFKNAPKFREISLRMAIKLADLRKMSATSWKSIAGLTCMKGG